MSSNKLPSIYWSAITIASQATLRGWMLIPALILTYVGYQFIHHSVGEMRLGIAGGFLLGALQLAVITFVYQWLLAIRDSRKISVEDLISFDTALFLDILNAAFPIFVVELILQQMVTGIGSLASLPIYLQLSIVFMLNPLPEIIMIDRPSSIEALHTAFHFVKSRLVEWFLPLIIIFTPLVLFTPKALGIQGAVLVLAQSEVLLPIELIFLLSSELFRYLSLTLFDISSSGFFTKILPLILGVICACWFSLFRLELYDRLRD